MYEWVKSIYGEKHATYLSKEFSIIFYESKFNETEGVTQTTCLKGNLKAELIGGQMVMLKIPNKQILDAKQINRFWMQFVHQQILDATKCLSNAK